MAYWLTGCRFECIMMMFCYAFFGHINDSKSDRYLSEGVNGDGNGNDMFVYSTLPCSFPRSFSMTSQVDCPHAAGSPRSKQRD